MLENSVNQHDDEMLKKEEYSNMTLGCREPPALTLSHCLEAPDTRIVHSVSWQASAEEFITGRLFSCGLSLITAMHTAGTEVFTVGVITHSLTEVRQVTSMSFYPLF